MATTNTIIGRKYEQSLLERFYNNTESAFIAVYGRRRVGKTYLIEEFFKPRSIFIDVVGTEKASKKEQLRAFHKTLMTFFPQNSHVNAPEDWAEAFYRLNNLLDTIDATQKITIFLDELPWLASPRSGFLQALEYIWNKSFCKRKNLIVVVCGSAASWMIKKIVQNTDGLYGRLSCVLSLPPFNLAEAQAFLESRKIHLDKHQLVQVFMTTGGIAAYLKYIIPGKSAMQIVNDLCFRRNAALLLEFNSLFQSLFDNPAPHINIVKALADNRRGLTQEKLLETVNLSRGGGATDIINELVACGFIASLPMYGKSGKENKFRLIDEYSLFYLCWIAKEYEAILRNSDPKYWHKMYFSPSWTSWSGVAFETICLKHILQIKKALGIASIRTSESYWQYTSPKHSEEEGAEIDLVIDRADDCIHICEIKFSKKAFTITKAYANKLINKLEIFREKTQTKKSLFLTFITPSGVIENMYYNDLVHQQITLEDLF